MWRSTGSRPSSIGGFGVLMLALLALCVACEKVATVPTPIAVGGTSSKATSIQILGEPPDVGGSAQLTAMGTFEGGLVIDLTNAVVWQSSDEAVATISPTGVLTGRSVGPIFVTATHHFRRSQRGMLISGPAEYMMFASHMGDPVGLGTTVFYDSVRENRIGQEQAFFAPFFAEGMKQVTVGFTPLPGQALVPGVYEAVGTRLRVVVDGRSCAQRQGRFVIYESVFSGSILFRFWATFEQWCDGRPESLVGEVSYIR